MFDPETTLQDLDDNVDFLESYARFPLNFGRVEAYSGTPLESRLRAENRLLGDYWGYSYQIRDPRVEEAFQLFKPVFTPRNFDDGGANLVAMRLDYLLHILAHFRPKVVPERLAAGCRRAVEDLNRHSVALLREIRERVSSGNLPDERERAELVRQLAAERESIDGRLRRRMAALIRDIERRSAPGRQRIFPRQAAAAAAAAAIVVSVSGCNMHQRDHHMYEMIMEPMEPPGKPEPPDTAKPAPKPPPKLWPQDWHMCEMMMRPIDPEKP
jgi:hypothetical protein